MTQLGFGALLLALISCSYAAAAAILGHLRRDRRLELSAQYAVYGSFGLLSVSSAVMLYLFAADEYGVKYVAHYSDRAMSLFYKLTAFWGGQDGSLLFWLWVMSLWAALAVYQNRNENREILPYTIATLMVIVLFFDGLVIFHGDPFATSFGLAPTDGRGLNPLLQNPYMVTHPPALYLGYIGWTIPFAFAIGALAHGKLDYSWIAAMRRSCLMAWMFLTVGLVLGGLWAYEELGWGGYWAWDPVENAAFMPWLTGTAYIHSIQVQERRGMYKMWNFVLIILTFLLTLIGTMMTRSGVVQSVHAFAQSDIGGYFIGFILLVAGVSFGLLLYRAKALRPQHALESVLSREFAFLVNNWILLAAAFFVTFATLFPSLYKALYSKEVNVGPSFYNQWMVPIGLLLLLLTGVGPLLSWRKSTARTILQQFLGPSLVGVAALLVSLGLGLYGWAALSCLALSAFVAATIVQEFWRGTRHRMRSAKEGPLDALLTIMTRQRRRYGGYVVHFGVVLMFFGFAGEGFKIEKDQTVKAGQRIEIGRYSVELNSLEYRDDGQKSMITAHTTARLLGDEAPIGHPAPARWAYRKPEEQVTTEVAKHMSLQDDLYLVLGGFDLEAQTATLQLKVNPLVNWVWLGGTFMFIGFGIAVWTEPARARQRAGGGRRWLPALASLGSFTLALLAAAWALV